MEIILIAVFLLHFIGDFVLQPYWLKVAKTKHFDALLLHVFIYFFVMVFGLSFIVDTSAAFYYTIVNTALHFVVFSKTGKHSG